MLKKNSIESLKSIEKSCFTWSSIDVHWFPVKKIEKKSFKNIFLKFNEKLPLKLVHNWIWRYIDVHKTIRSIRMQK